MRVLSLRRLLDKCCRLCGLDPARLDPEVGSAMVGWLEARLGFAWTAFPWPFLIVIEERAWRNAWLEATAYSEGDEVSHVDEDGVTGYWVALADAAEDVEPGTDEEVWGELSTSDRTIPFAQRGRTSFEDLFSVTARDPRTSRVPGPVPYWLGAETVHLDRQAPATVFVQFRRRTPRLTTERWDEELGYDPGEAVYFDDDDPKLGDSYVALDKAQIPNFALHPRGIWEDAVLLWNDLRRWNDARPAATGEGPAAGESPETHPEYWELQEIPDLLAEYAARAAKADYLADDGQDDKSFAQDRRAIDWLELQMVNTTVLKNQTANYSVR